MNRSERRKLLKRTRGENITLEKGSENIDRSNAQWCWLHNLQLDNIDKPTERDKRLIASVRLKPYKGKDKNGKLIIGRSCPRCGNIIIVNSPLLDSQKHSIINSGETENGSLLLSDMREEI